MPGGPTAQLLAILVVPVVAGMVCLLVATLRQGPARARVAEQDTVRERDMVFSLADAFDPEHVAIWESQLPLLELLAAGVGKLEFCVTWDRFSKRFPELYDGATPSDWLQLLRKHNLAESLDTKVRLTPCGRELLQYLARHPGVRERKAPGGNYKRLGTPPPK
jgi:hypothetical protein